MVFPLLIPLALSGLGLGALFFAGRKSAGSGASGGVNYQATPTGSDVTKTQTAGAWAGTEIGDLFDKALGGLGTGAGTLAANVGAGTGVGAGAGISAMGVGVSSAIDSVAKVALPLILLGVFIFIIIKVI